MKVMVAAAAAIAFLVVVPTVEQQSRPNMETYVAEAKEQVNKDLQEQKEKAKKRSEEQNFLQSVMMRPVHFAILLLRRQMDGF